MEKNNYGGMFIAVDGPNGAGKSTIIECVGKVLGQKNLKVHITKEPTYTSLGDFTRREAECLQQDSLACLVAADRYNHLSSCIIPHLKKGYIVITDRYVLSSLALQRMDNVSVDFILNINSNILLPDIQIIVEAKSDIIQQRLNQRNQLTRFERGNRTLEEMYFFRCGGEILSGLSIRTVTIDNSKNLDANVQYVVQTILGGLNDEMSSI